MEELARVYSEALFAAASEQGKIDLHPRAARAFADALEQNRELNMFFFSPLFSTREKKEGIERVLVGADESFVNFLKLLIDNHRMPVIFRIRRQYEALWREENRLLPVEVTSAVELDDEVARQIQAARRAADRAHGGADAAASTTTSSAGSSCASAT